jgi:hypothetical protein
VKYLVLSFVWIVASMWVLALIHNIWLVPLGLSINMGKSPYAFPLFMTYSLVVVIPAFYIVIGMDREER